MSDSPEIVETASLDRWASDKRLSGDLAVRRRSATQERARTAAGAMIIRPIRLPTPLVTIRISADNPVTFQKEETIRHRSDPLDGEDGHQEGGNNGQDSQKASTMSGGCKSSVLLAPSYGAGRRLSSALARRLYPGLC